MLNFTSSPLPKPSNIHRRTLSSLTPAEDSRSSSLQKVWAEDYYSDETSSFENSWEDNKNLITPPRPATLTERHFPRSVPVTEDEEPAIPRQKNQRTLTSLLPFRSPTRSPERSPQRSPTKEKSDFDFMPTFTGDQDGQIKIADKGKGGIAGWFSGSSAPVSMGIPTEDEEDMTPREILPERTPTRLRKNTPPSVDTTPKSSNASRFAFFSPKQAIHTVQVPAALKDEFLTLDIKTALFPTGLPKESDPFSPSAFKNLLQNAEGLLGKMQSAYQLRTLTLHEIQAEKEAQVDELEESETRTQHLKIQLQDMARQAMEKDAIIEELRAEVAVERKAREDERVAREKSIALIKSHRPSLSTDSFQSSTSSVSDKSSMRTVEHRRERKWMRTSDGTMNSEMSEADFSSDDESAENHSVFDRSLSPAPTTASMSDMSVLSARSNDTCNSMQSMPEVGYARMIHVRQHSGDARAINLDSSAPASSSPMSSCTITSPSTNTQQKNSQRPQTVQRTSTFHRILNGKSSNETVTDRGDKSNSESAGDERGIAENGCSNCRGGTSSVAWDSVGLLRLENKGLKERVVGLSVAVEEALDMVRGYGV